MKFEMEHVLLDIIAWLTLVNLFSEFLICTNNINQFMRQIVVHALIIVHDNGRSNSEWWDSENGAYHPSGMREFGVESKNANVFVSHALEAP